MARLRLPSYTKSLKRCINENSYFLIDLNIKVDIYLNNADSKLKQCYGFVELGLLAIPTYSLDNQ